MSTTSYPMSVTSTGAASINHAIADYLYQLRTNMNKMERVIGKIAKIDNSVIRETLPTANDLIGEMRADMLTLDRKWTAFKKEMEVT